MRRNEPKKWSNARLRTWTFLINVALATSGEAALAAGPYAYVPSNFNATVSVVDIGNTAATPAQFTIDTPRNLGFFGVSLSAATGMLYLSADYDEGVYQIDTATGSLVRRYSVGDNPRGIAVDASGKHVYVANFASASLSVIDTTTQTVTDIGLSPNTSAFANPLGVALNLTGTRAYITDTSVGHRVCKVNTSALPALIDDCIVVGDNDSANPTALAVSPDGSRVYVVIHGHGSSVEVVDVTGAPMRVLRSIPVNFGSPNGIAVSASGKRAYVGTAGGKIVALNLEVAEDTSQDPVIGTVEDPDQVVSTVQGVSISPDGTRLLAADFSGMLHVVDIVNDANTLIDSVTVNLGPYALGQFTKPDAIFVSGFEKSG